MKAIGFLLMLLLAISSCGSPTIVDVRKDFIKQYPNAEIISISPGEGDGSAVYMHIKYKQTTKSTVILEDVWQYLDKGGTQWELTHKETLSQ